MDKTRSDPPSREAPASGPVGDIAVHITQSARELVMDRVVEGRRTRVTYRLDGVEIVNNGPLGGQLAARSRWEGATLVTDTRQVVNSPAGPLTLKAQEVRTLDPQGRIMTVVTTTALPSGARTRRLVFRRVPNRQ
ncbi:MAG: hypothetical protein HYX76_13315 [Acidobacteria bacterium]|nr:hypothetical protein [Acidobacteriota bacterium]